MDAEEARRIAKLSAPDDPAQQAITEQALRQAGERELTIVHVTLGAPPWQVVFVDDGAAVTYAGMFTYGGESYDEALRSARRIASKWDWRVVEPPECNRTATAGCDTTVSSFGGGGGLSDLAAAEPAGAVPHRHRVVLARRTPGGD